MKTRKKIATGETFEAETKIVHTPTGRIIDLNKFTSIPFKEQIADEMPWLIPACVMALLLAGMSGREIGILAALPWLLLAVTFPVIAYIKSVLEVGMDIMRAQGQAMHELMTCNAEYEIMLNKVQDRLGNLTGEEEKSKRSSTKIH